MKNFISLFIHNFDDINDLKNSVLGIVALATLTFTGLSFSFIPTIYFDYFIMASSGMVGQVAMYLAKIRFPHYFGKHEDKRTLGRKILHFMIDCFLASIVSMLCSQYLVDFLFTSLSLIQKSSVETDPVENIKRLILCSFLVGAFYETLLKKAIKKNKEIDQDKSKK